MKYTTDPDEMKILETCLAKIEDVTQYINDSKRLAEKLQRIVEIQMAIDGAPGLVGSIVFGSQGRT